jgi:hypothetical protein
VLDAIDLHKDLIEVPLPLCILEHVGGSFRPDLTGEDRTNSIDPESYAFVTNIDATLVEEVFDIAQRKWKSDIHCNRKLDDLWRRLKVVEWVLSHGNRLDRFKSIGQGGLR